MPSIRCASGATVSPASTSPSIRSASRGQGVRRLDQALEPVGERGDRLPRVDQALEPARERGDGLGGDQQVLEPRDHPVDVAEAALRLGDAGVELRRAQAQLRLRRRDVLVQRDHPAGHGVEALERRPGLADQRRQLVGDGLHPVDDPVGGAQQAGHARQHVDDVGQGVARQLGQPGQRGVQHHREAAERVLRAVEQVDAAVHQLVAAAGRAGHRLRRLGQP